MARETLDWADVHLRGLPSKRTTDVRVFVMGADEWRDLAERPPPATPTPFHLHRELRLGIDQPMSADPDRFRYDPADPTPSLGGASLSSKAGPKDNKPRESRSEVHARNLGSGEPTATATTFRVADQEIFHDPEHPSSVILPIV